MVEFIAIGGRGAAGAPGLSIDRHEANFGVGFIAAAASNQDGAVDEGQLVVLLQEDHQAVRELDAPRLHWLERMQRTNRNLLPLLCGCLALSPIRRLVR